MNKDKNIEDVKKAAAEGSIDIKEVAKSLKISPSKKKILNMTKDQLLKYNALIFHKGCKTLSSSERSMVQERIAYGLNRSTITTEEVAKEINSLNALIRGELKKVLNDDSIVNE